MAQDPSIKKIPLSTSEVAKMLGIAGAEHDLPMGTFISHGDLPVANLPVAQPAGADGHAQTNPKAQNPAEQNNHSNSEKPHVEALSETLKAQDSKTIRSLKTFGPYVGVFVVGLFLYYFFFSAVNFSAVFTPAPKAAAPTQSAISQLETEDASSYNSWISGFYYDVNNPAILDPEADNSGNGLSNFQKYLLNLNPKSYDTLGLGQPDSETLAQGTDPSTGAPLSAAQQAIVSKYIDMEVVMNRLTLNGLQHPSAVAGVAVNANGTSVLPAVQVQNSQPTAPNQNTATVTGDNLGDNILNSDGISINTNIPGRLEIPDLKINVPIIWTKDTNDFETDLESGVVHYPGTALPGELGTSYIAGHSSNYVWAKGDYNHIFTHLDQMAVNTSFQITVVQTNGQNAIFHYVVTHSQQYSPTDQAQFANTGQSVVALSTCWPVNSTAKRLVVFGVLTQVEK